MLGDDPLSAVRDCFFNIFAATLHMWVPFVCPQPEDIKQDEMRERHNTHGRNEKHILNFDRKISMVNITYEILTQTRENIEMDLKKHHLYKNYYCDKRKEFIFFMPNKFPNYRLITHPNIPTKIPKRIHGFRS
jgi:hypothetical protein